MLSNTSNNASIYLKTLLFIVVLFSISHFNCGCDSNSVTSDSTLPFPVVLILIDYEAAWSPDARTIAYIHNEQLNPLLSGIYLIDTNGNNKRLLKSGYICNSPDWSPDGNWIVFTESFFDSSKSQLYKIKSNGDSLTQLTFKDENINPSWSDNSDWIVYQKSENSTFGKYCIWKMKSDGSQKTVIGCDSGYVIQREPHWSNGKIVFVRDTIVNEGYAVSNFYLMNPDGSQLEKVNNNEIQIRKPKLSPDGNFITFFRHVSIYDTEQQTWMINSDGSNLHQVSRYAGYPDWSPDGQKIVYSDSRPENRLLWIMNKDGSGKKQLTY